MYKCNILDVILNYILNRTNITSTRLNSTKIEIKLIKSYKPKYWYIFCKFQTIVLKYKVLNIINL